MRCTRRSNVTAVIHGFLVLAQGSIPSGFASALKLLQTRGFEDDSCIVVKTTLGKLSGVTHEGGRYVHPKNPYAREVITAMRRRGIDPPPMPFVLAPGPVSLLHEWGHHVDTVWSGEDVDVPFSFRWFSHLYQISYRRPLYTRSAALHERVVERIETEDQAIDVVPQWQMLASELFADLFEDWMRGSKRRSWDVCDSCCADQPTSDHANSMRPALLPGVTTGEVRKETYNLFERGLRPAPDRPVVRDDLLGPYTAYTLDRLREVMKRLRAESGTV